MGIVLSFTLGAAFAALLMVAFVVAVGGAARRRAAAESAAAEDAHSDSYIHRSLKVWVDSMPNRLTKFSEQSRLAGYVDSFESAEMLGGAFLDDREFNDDVAYGMWVSAIVVLSSFRKGFSLTAPASVDVELMAVLEGIVYGAVDACLSTVAAEAGHEFECPRESLELFLDEDLDYGE